LSGRSETAEGSTYGSAAPIAPGLPGAPAR
jgi:hypothetical protein